MKRVLIPGMSGAGKSSLLDELAARGHRAVDTDYGDYFHAVDGESLWREDRISALLDSAPGQLPGVLFVQGTTRNQVLFYPRFDHIILLSAPIKTMLQRLEARTGNPYGQVPGDLDRVVSDTQNIEPLLRRAADHEIATTMPLHDVVTGILRLASE